MSEWAEKRTPACLSFLHFISILFYLLVVFRIMWKIESVDKCEDEMEILILRWEQKGRERERERESVATQVASECVSECSLGNFRDCGSDCG